MTETDFEPSVVIRTLSPAAPGDGGVVYVLIEVIAPPGPGSSLNGCATATQPAGAAPLNDVDGRAVGAESAQSPALEMASSYFNAPTPQQIAEGIDVCWSSLRITLIPSEDVLAVDPPSTSTSRRPSYALPDLRFGSVSSLLLRLSVGPSDQSHRILFSVKLRATSELHQNMVMLGIPGPELANVDAEALATLPADQAVAAALIRAQAQ